MLVKREKECEGRDVGERERRMRTERREVRQDKQGKRSKGRFRGKVKKIKGN